jgi:hypothetical protein
MVSLQPMRAFVHQIAAVTFHQPLAHIAIWRPHSPLRPCRDRHEMPPPRSSCRWACQFAPRSPIGRFYPADRSPLPLQQFYVARRSEFTNWQILSCRAAAKIFLSMGLPGACLKSSRPMLLLSRFCFAAAISFARRVIKRIETRGYSFYLWALCCVRSKWWGLLGLQSAFSCDSFVSVRWMPVQAGRRPTLNRLFVASHCVNFSQRGNFC